MDMVAIGVLNSWVILLMKSDFISDIFFCRIIRNILKEKVRKIIKVNATEIPSNKFVVCPIKRLLSGKLMANSIFFLKTSSGNKLTLYHFTGSAVFVFVFRIL